MNPLARFLALAGFAVALASCQMFTPPEVQESGFQPSDRPITVDNVGANNKLAELAKAQFMVPEQTHIEAAARLPATAELDK